MLGTIIRRNWRFTKVNDPVDSPRRPYLLTGPLCTTLDTLSLEVELPELKVGDVISVGMSGAYGLTCSPVRFISHPEATEVAVTGTGPDAEIRDVSEDWSPRRARPSLQHA